MAGENAKVYKPQGGDALNVAAGGLIDGSGGSVGAGGDIVSNYSAAAASGAITQKSGTVVITKAGVAALTLADPTSGAPSAGGDDGKRLTFISATANAHTLDNSAGSGFNAGGAASDVGTFGGAKGDNITLIAYAGKWYVESKTNVTLG